MSTLNTNGSVPTFTKFVIGGISGVIGQTVTHPMDVLKIRMQISRKSNLRETALHTYSTSGIRGFYAGLSAALLRQMTYTTTRLGVYTTLLDIGERHFDHLNYITMISFGMIAGVMGSFVGTPTDLLLVRMIADADLPPEKRRNYRNAFGGILEVWRNEGFTRLWRGAVPTMGRAALVNGTQLGTYTRMKDALRETKYFENDVLLQFVAAMISGLVTSFISLPVDAAKTRIQNWKQPTKAPNVVTSIVNIARSEGPMSLWRGYLPYYCRAGPNTIITMICVDQLHRLYLKFFPMSQ